MSLFPDLPRCGGHALWGSAALRQLWWQSGAGGLCKRRDQHHLLGENRTTKDLKKKKKKEGGAESLESWGLACVCPPLLSLICTHAQTHSPLASPFFPPCLSPPLSDAGVVNSRTLALSCMEAQGGAGSPGKSHFLFFLFFVPQPLSNYTSMVAECLCLLNDLCYE